MSHIVQDHQQFWTVIILPRPYLQLNIYETYSQHMPGDGLRSHRSPVSSLIHSRNGSGYLKQLLGSSGAWGLVILSCFWDFCVITNLKNLFVDNVLPKCNFNVTIWNYKSDSKQISSIFFSLHLCVNPYMFQRGVFLTRFTSIQSMALSCRLNSQSCGKRESFLTPLWK